MQTDYRHSFPAGSPGLPYDSSASVINSRAAQGDDIGFGVAVLNGSVPGETVALSGGGTFAGITVNTWIKELDRDGTTVKNRDKDTLAVMSFGRIWAKLSDTVATPPAYGAAVHRMSDGTFAVSGGVAVPNARFIPRPGEADDGVCPIELR